ncbi:MAG TPA: T9SS type A sorting domain-containing protein [Ignavibacteria bacterium]|nr:T9SS type A sorting domain-containing protein [Ignavibacteria bacterium]
MIIILVLDTSFIAAQWLQTKGPEGGTVTSIICNDTSIFIGCSELYGGGVFKSTNDGNNWTDLQSGLSQSNQDSRALILKDDILLSGTINGIIKSTDGGNDWQNCYFGTSVVSMCTSNNNIFAGLAKGIIMSSNNGLTWVERINGLTELSVNIIKSFKGKLYTGTSNGLFFSTDDGNNWTLISQTLQHNIINDVEVRGETIYVATSFGGVYKSSNHGNDWVNISSKIFNTNPIVLKLNDDKLFASFQGIGLFCTTNNGINWTYINQGLPSNPIIISISTRGEMMFVGSFGEGIYRSTDNGNNWNEINNGIIATTILSMENINNRLIVGTNRGVYFTDNSGMDWHHASSGISCTYISALKKHNNVLYAGSAGGCGMKKSTDNGVSWQSINFNLDEKAIYDITAEGSYIFLATNQGVYYSNNEGLFWIRIDNIPLDSYSSIEFMNSQLFTSTENKVYRSSNYGQSWTQTNTGIPQNAIIQDFESFDSKLFAVSTSGMFLSTNYGNSWFLSNNGLPSLPLETIVRHGNKLILSTSLNGIYFSSNSGQNWFPLNIDLTARTNSLLSLDSTIYAGTYGEGVFKMYMSTVGIINQSELSPDAFELFQNYPNPFNPQTRIEFDLSKQSLVSLTIYNIKGQVIKELLKNVLKEAGRYSLIFDGSKFPSGIYFYELMSSEFKQNRIMILTK